MGEDWMLEVGSWRLEVKSPKPVRYLQR